MSPLLEDAFVPFSGSWCLVLSNISVCAAAGHAVQDTFGSKTHSEKLHKAYTGDENTSPLGAIAVGTAAVLLHLKAVPPQRITSHEADFVI